MTQNYKLGDCSKKQLLKVNKELVHRLNNVSIVAQVIACELRTTDKENSIFKTEQGLLNEEQVKDYDKYISNGDYAKYRKECKK